MVFCLVICAYLSPELLRLIMAVVMMQLHDHTGRCANTTFYLDGVMLLQINFW
jgi:hypothetical protein